jgi:hypothetical protein
LFTPKSDFTFKQLTPKKKITYYYKKINAKSASEIGRVNELYYLTKHSTAFNFVLS